MNKILIVIALFAANLSFAQAPVEWKEKDDFHKVMAQTFHPMEEGNYNPIKERSQEMYDKAVAWQKSAVPTGVNKKKAKKILKKLVAETAELNKEIKEGATDATIKEELTELHDLFHDLVGLCKHE
ncbi:MAG: hypothetical protein ACKVQB_05440 [Bacteroidia bacterium]